MAKPTNNMHSMSNFISAPQPYCTVTAAKSLAGHRARRTESEDKRIDEKILIMFEDLGRCLGHMRENEMVVKLSRLSTMSLRNIIDHTLHFQLIIRLYLLSRSLMEHLVSMGHIVIDNYVDKID
ncbi:unnamed protein product [Sphenostylis stenocarpa]|uniref:Uncharacterized protein n=1 Tax=Sphenostylis stenocarpa TaxID=92480 RepID=A0AA86VR79_9FABA|nr:unnamed protein product [Sphenostylis stenocarpa]